MTALVQLHLAIRFLLELLVLGAAGAALVATGRLPLAAGLAAVAVANRVLVLLLDQ